MNRLLVLDLPGLSLKHIAQMPALSRLAREGCSLPLEVVTPAVTCSVQSAFLTGTMPGENGIVGNGWYFRDLNETFFWRQSNALVQGEKVWEAARKIDPAFTVANMFWWYNMYSSADYSATPRPLYLADGRKIPDCYAHPPELRDELTRMLGPFPLFRFWGPAADISSTRWITEASLHVLEKYAPTLTLVYLPHLDYNMQRLGPNHPDIQGDLEALDKECARLLDYAREKNMRALIVSEYSISAVQGPVFLNRILRKAGWLRVKNELGREAPDFGASDAFAVCDHQVAHVYVKNPRLVPEVQRTLEAQAGVDIVLDHEGKKEYGLDHERSGELVALAEPDFWFSYYHWLDDSRAPDYARTVDIHRKPGYDPVELFIDPALRFPKLAIGKRLLKKKLGFRSLMDVIPLDASLVRGSHGRISPRSEDSPAFLSSRKLEEESLHATRLKPLMLEMIFGKERLRSPE